MVSVSSKITLATTVAAAMLFSVAIALPVTPASAAEEGTFAEGSQAREWGLAGEEKATFTGKVVDITCELAGDCADNCGNGNRNLGIVREADNVLVLVMKNSQAAFNGAVEDLLPYCNKRVDVDGVLVGADEFVSAKFYMVQSIREVGAPEWSKANLWTKRWAEKNPNATTPSGSTKGPWFRRDPRVLKQLAKDGHFGLGLEVDQQYILDNE
ncbi:MAG: hypothetical protein AAFO98_04445 [Pseudomonadota bacterium]